MNERNLKQDPMQQTITVDLSTATAISCICGGEIFVPAFRIKRLSALLSPSGQEMIIPVQTLICIKCNFECDVKGGG